MAHRRHPPRPPERFDPPDVGFMAAAGGYVAAVLVAASIAVSVAVGATAATAIGAVSSAITIGLVAGGIVSGRVRGLPERLGRGWRPVLPFAVPAVFAAATVLALAIPPIPPTVGFGTGIGAGITLFAALAVASMARTRYAKAMTPDEPVVSIPLLRRTRDRRWIGLGAVSVALTGLLWTATGLGRFTLGLGTFGAFAVWHGLSVRFALRDPDRDGWLRRRFETNPFEPNWSDDGDVQWLPELRVHDAGVVVRRPAQRRFVPWEAVSGVRLTADELVIGRHGRFDVRCDRTVIDNPERVYRAIERARTGEPARDGAESPPS